MTDIKSKLKVLSSDLFWSTLGTVVSRGLALFMTYICARLLSNQELVQWLWLFATTVVFSIFSSHSLGMASLKFVAANDDLSVRKAYSGASLICVLYTSIFACLLTLPFSSVIATSILNSESSTMAVCMTILSIPFMSITGSLQGTLSGLGMFSTIATYNIWTSIASVLMICAGILGFERLGLSPLLGATIGLLLTSILQAVWLLVVTNRVFREAVESTNINRKTVRKQIITYAVPIFFAGLAYQGGSWLATTFLAVDSKRAVEFNVFQIALQWQIMFLFLPTILGKVLLRQYAKQSDSESNQKNWTMIGHYIALVTTIIPVIILSPFSGKILALYKPEYASHSAIFTLVMLSSIVLAITINFHRKLMVTASPWIITISDLGFGLALVLLSWLTLNYGGYGLAWARIAACTLYLLLIYYFYRRLYNTAPADNSSDILHIDQPQKSTSSKEQFQ